MKQLVIKLKAAERDELYTSVLEASHLDIEYVAMLALAALIALFGLLQNSVAVIIGAMLISPLMNPVLAGGLALVLGDWSLGRRAASVLAWSTGGAIALTWLVASLTPLKQVTPEILARTNPNLLDMLIAVMAGLAGTLALRGGPVSMTIIPGVAIAVAVIPPLSVVGFALSTHHGAMAWGGFLLFLTNLVSIMISAAVVFRLMGFVPHEDTEEGRTKLYKRMAVSTVLMVVLAVPLVQTLRRAVVQIGLRADVANIVDRGFKTGHSTVADLSYARQGESYKIDVTVRTTQYFGTPEIDAVQAALRRRLGPNAQLLVDQILVAQGGLSAEEMARIKNFISGRVVETGPKPETFDLAATQGKITSYLAKQVDEVLLGTPLHTAGPVQALLGTGSPVGLDLRLAAQAPLEKQTIKLLASQLSAKISSPVELHGVVELKSPDYTLDLELAGLQRGLDWRDRRKLLDLATTVLKRPDLVLQASLSAPVASIEMLKASRLWRDVDDTLRRSRLQPSQWTLEATPVTIVAPAETIPAKSAPSAPGAKGPTPAKPSGPVRCDFNVIQDF